MVGAGEAQQFLRPVEETAVVADYYKKMKKYSSVSGVGEEEQIFKNICREVDKSLLM